jgi:isoquinoline 1-oxidoreductase
MKPASENPVGPPVADRPAPSRREFLNRLAGGLFVFVALRDLKLLAVDEPTRGGAAGRDPAADFNAFLRIAADGRITCFTGKIEMGQGPITSLPQMLADEIEAPVDSIDMVMGDTDLCPFDAGTWGSMTTRGFGPALRAAAAEAKAVLLDLAADQLKAPVAQLVAKDGAIFDRQNPTRRVTYGQLTQGRRIERHLNVAPTLKDFAQFTVMGKPRLRQDAHAKVTGQAHYAGDIRLPGMLYARILRPPAHGATRRSLDLSAARQVPGVLVVEDGDLVAVLHERPDAAEAALGKIQAAFDRPVTGVDDRTIFEHLVKLDPAARVVSQSGDLDAGRALATRRFAKTYLNSYVAHSPMETHTALAVVADGKATVWASTQSPFGARGEIAQALGFAPEQVRVITPFLGGGFGGKAPSQQASEAARLAQRVGRPVQVAWTREEEIFNDTFRPAAIVKIDSGLDAAGRVAYWDFDVYYAGDRGSAHFYAFPNSRTRARDGGPTDHPFATGAWRAPGNNTNTFARESHLDVLAAAAGADPVEFRLRHLTDPRMIRVVQAAAQRFGWVAGVGPSHRGYGVACGIDAGTYVCAMAEVAVDPARGTVRVKRVACAQDMGIVINPAGATIQMEGCITMGLGYTLSEEVRFKDGQILDTNFDTYELPRFSGLPEIETVILENNTLAPQGGGEPAIVVMGAVIANAIHDAVGVRMLQLPMTPSRIKAALQSV